MAGSASAAVDALRACEQALAWEPLELDPSGEALASIEGPVFLKGNQNSGRFLVRRESGLGEGMLIHRPQRCGSGRGGHLGTVAAAVLPAKRRLIKG